MQENKTPYSYHSESDKLKLETFSFWNFFFYVHKMSLFFYFSCLVAEKRFTKELNKSTQFKSDEFN